MKKMTHRLIVNGDVSSKGFFLSHHVLQELVRRIFQIFQKFCVERRDVEGSIQLGEERCGRIH